jgi:hypothetical protein
MTLTQTWNALAGKIFPVAQPAGIAEIRRREMMAAGERLIDVLGIEQELLEIHISLTEDEALLNWQECRRTVDRLTEDYAWAVAKWRESGEETAGNCTRAPSPASKAFEGSLGPRECHSLMRDRRETYPFR